jgi:prepilin-type N-terminal cleavage/methylation domain-containing protein
MNFIEKKKLQRGQGGFTLIELLVVVAILAVLAGLAVIGIGAMRENAEDTACKADQDTLATAAEALLVQNPEFTGDAAATKTALYETEPKLVKRWPTTGATVEVQADGTVLTAGC